MRPDVNGLLFHTFPDTLHASMLEKARNFAVHAHGDQRYGERPYSVHLDAVVATLDQYGETAQVIGFLHDVVEDTEITNDTLRAHFGDFIADCVAVLTDEFGTSRQERKLKTNHKLLLADGELELALVVKAADRLANVRACVSDGDERRLNMYREEHVPFRCAAYRTGLCDELWDDLDRLLGFADAPTEAEL